MKKIFIVFIVFFVSIFAEAKEAVVMNSNNTMDTFNRMYNIGTTQEVVFVNDMMLFNEIAVPTYASAQVDGNKIAFVRGNDVFASYAVKFVKETRTTYVFVAETNEVITEEVSEDLIVLTKESETVVATEESEIEGLLHFGSLVALVLALALAFGKIFKKSLRAKVEANINVGYTISKDLVISNIDVKYSKGTRYFPVAGYLPLIANTSNLKVVKKRNLIKIRLKTILNILRKRLKIYKGRSTLIRLILYCRLKIIYKNEFSDSGQI